MKDLFADLEPLAKQLDEATAGLNGVLENARKRLAELRLGLVVSVEFKGAFACTSFLTYMRHNGIWDLFIIEDAGEEPKPVMETARNFRIKAVAMLPEFIYKLRIKAEKLLEEINEKKAP